MNPVFSAGSNRLNVDRRGQLIESTIEVIYRDGLSRLTLAKVAHQAGLSTSIVNFYFKTKEQLLLETLQTVSQEYEAAVDKAFASSSDPVETLKTLVEAMLDPELCTPARAAVWYAFMGESQARADYSRAVRVRELAIRQRIEGLFTDLFSEVINAVNIAYLVQSFVAEGVDWKGLCPSALELLLQLAAILCGAWDLVPTAN